MKTAVLLGMVYTGLAYGQPVCPAINFQQMAQLKVQNRPQQILSGLLRQPDRSFSQYEITGTYGSTNTSLVGVLPNIQQGFFTCSGLTAHNPGAGAAPNRSKDPLGTASRNAIITDLAGDGLGAIVGLDYRLAAQGLIVVTANPDFSVRASATYPVGQNPLGVVAGDFNGDGLHDVAVVYNGPASNATPGGISLLLGTGTGTVQSAVNYPAGLGTMAAAVWDFNKDGKDDLAVLNYQDGTVTIMFGNANGKLTTGKTYTVDSFGFPTGFAVADVDGDGNPDLVMAGFNNIYTLLGNGDGTFRTGPSTAFNTALSFLATGDFNKDGKMDVALTDHDSGLLYILLGDGHGGFTPVSQYVVGYAPGTFYVEDFDGDGNLDIVFAQGHPDALINLPYTQVVGVLFGKGDGTFAGAPAYLVPGGPTSIVSADFNGDGKPDLAVPGQVLLGKGGGQFQLGVTLNGGRNTYEQIAAADFNGDSKTDLVVNNAVFLGNGDGTFQAAKVVPGSTAASGVAVGDFNNDHKMDLAIPNVEENTIGIYPGHGDGTFGAGATYPVGSYPSFTLAGDFNRDGNLDLAVVNQGFVFMNNNPGGLSILLGKGDGTFQTPVTYTAQSIFWPNSVSMGDINKDGIPDLIVSAATEGFNSALVIFIGKGDGTFKPGVLISTEFGPEAPVIGDFNGDGKVDLIVPHCCGDSDVTYALGNGDGTFQKEVPIVYNTGAYSWAAGDYNGDGKPDLAFVTPTVGPYGSSVFVLLNVPVPPAPTAAIFSAANAATVGVAPGSLAIAYGNVLATSVAGAAPYPYPLSWGGTSLSILDSAGVSTGAPLLYVSPGQVNFEVPPGIAIGPAQAIVTSGDGTKSTAAIQIAAVAPGLFTLNAGGLAAADVAVYHPDGSYTAENVFSVNGAGQIVANPVSLGASTDNAYLLLFGTGLQAAGTAGVTLTIGGIPVQAAYAGPQGGFVGLDQVNALIPPSLAGKGNVTIQLKANGLSANTVNLTIK